MSTPRRFGKTISVSMFAAAIMFSAPGIEMSIYSTCKRISQKLLRNIVKFMDLIYVELGIPPFKVARMNSEEVHISGPEGRDDLRVVNSYPSKIGRWTPFLRARVVVVIWRPKIKLVVLVDGAVLSGPHARVWHRRQRRRTHHPMASMALEGRSHRAAHGALL